MATITFTLPDDLVRAAGELGLLDPAVFAALLQAEVRRCAFAEISAVSEQLSAVGATPMSEDEIQAEIRAARANKRAACT
jgi:hypothetical protein